MKKVKVSVINPFTLRLEENGEKGDIIDLQELQKVDNAPIIEAIQNAKDQTYKSLLAKEIEQQEIKKQIALTELEKKLNQQFEDMKIEKDRLSLLVEGIDSRIQQEQKSTKTELSAIFDIEKNKLESKIKELEQSLSNQKALIELQITKAKDDEMNSKIETYKNQVFTNTVREWVFHGILSADVSGILNETFKKNEVVSFLDRIRSKKDLIVLIYGQ